MTVKTRPSLPASEHARPTCLETRVPEWTLDGDLTLKSPEARDWWLCRVAALICARHVPKAGQAYRDHAQSCGVREALERAILIHDIEVSAPLVRKKLAQNIVFVFLNLEKDHSSDDIQICLGKGEDKLLENLQLSLSIQDGALSKGTGHDESQMISLVRGLLEVSGGRQDDVQHRFAEEYTPGEIADLYASLFGIARTNQFGDFDLEAMRNTLLRSPVFFEETITGQDLEQWSTKTKVCLFLGFQEGYLGLPSYMLSGFSFGQADSFNIYLANTYLAFPELQRPGNTLLLLLTWSAAVLDRPLKVICEWATSEAGRNLYDKLASDFQVAQDVEPLALTIAALLSYRRLLPDYLDHVDQPVNGGYLTDLHALLHGYSLGNSGAVAERIVFSLVRVLRSSVNPSEDLVTFLETVLDRDPPLLHPFDGFSDQYVLRRISGDPHQTAMEGLSHSEMPELGWNNDLDWVNVTRSEGLSLQNCSRKLYDDGNPEVMETEDSAEQPHGGSPLHLLHADAAELVNTAGSSEEDTTSPCITTALSSEDECYLASSSCIDQYKLVRLSGTVGGIQKEDILEILDTQVRTVNDVPNIEELGDGSWELLVLHTDCPTLEATIGTLLPGLDVDIDYDPEQPTIDDLKHWTYSTAKQLNQSWFRQRAVGVIKRRANPAADWYASRLPLEPTCQGYLQSKTDAVRVVEACLRGELRHAYRGPRDREAIFSGDVFIWERNATGIDHWRDGREWIFRNQDGFEVGEATDGSGLVRKTTSILAGRTVHHVVCYCTAGE